MNKLAELMELAKKFGLRKIAKTGFLLVVLGFFMPISCNMNGFQVTKVMDGFSSLLMYLMFLSALAGVAVGVMLMLNKNMLPVIAEWIILGVCVGSGLLVFFFTLNNTYEFQMGAYVIILGWVVAVAGHVMAKKNGEL
jgi:hypothetical protein